MVLQGSFVSRSVLHGFKTLPLSFSPLFFRFLLLFRRIWCHAWTTSHYVSERDRCFWTLWMKFLGLSPKRLGTSCKKCDFYAREIRWCCRTIDKTGFKMDPRTVEAPSNMHLPISHSELCQFVHCCRSLSTIIPIFQLCCKPPTEWLEATYALTGKRKKSALKNLALFKRSRGAKQEAAFKCLQNALKTQSN